LKAKGIAEVIVYCCNDGAVMMAWGKDQCVEGSLVTMMADTQGALTKALGVSMTHPGPIGVLGEPRCQRHAIYVEDGIIKAFEVSASPDDPAGDDNPEATCVDNMLSHVPELPSPAKETALEKLEAEKKQDVSDAEAAINSAELVLFVKPSCSFSEQALEELMSNGFQPRVFKTTRSQKRGLQELTGKTSMPSAWCNGTYIGGCNDGTESWHGVKPMVAGGKLKQMMALQTELSSMGQKEDDKAPIAA
jgi:glutaredoxin-related protein